MNSNFTWNYQMPNYITNALQKDWNQTIWPTFNIIRLNILKENEIIKCVAPIKFKSFMETIHLYDSEKQTLNDYFLFEYIDNNDIDYILINENLKLEIQNYNN